MTLRLQIIYRRDVDVVPPDTKGPNLFFGFVKLSKTVDPDLREGTSFF